MALSDLNQSKDIRIEGISLLPRSVVEKQLPLDRSVAWWLANKADIQSRLAKNPWVERVSIEGCSGAGMAQSWGCFVVLVKERRARFVASVDSESWLIAEDGTFLSPVDSDDWHGVKRFAVPGVLKVDGLASRVSSPDILRAQLAVARSASDTLENALGRRISALQFSAKGDLSVSFKGFPFPIVFNASSDTAALNDQADRARALLPKLSARLGDIEKIDLAFSKVGVVTFKGSTSPAK
jgi:hypothetical protein